MTSKKKEIKKKENKQIVEIHIYIHQQGVWTTPNYPNNPLNPITNPPYFVTTC